MNPTEVMHRIDALLSHVWMVRCFLKHSEEGEEDEDLQEVQRELYDYMLALGGPLRANDPDGYLKFALKKFAKVRKASEFFAEVQPQVSTHTNFQMAVYSLKTAIAEIGKVLESTKSEI